MLYRRLRFFSQPLCVDVVVKDATLRLQRVLAAKGWWALVENSCRGWIVLNVVAVLSSRFVVCAILFVVGVVIRPTVNQESNIALDLAGR